MIVIDTSVWIDFLTGAESAHRHELHRLIETGQDIGLTEVSLTEVSLTEILQGIKSDTLFNKTKNYLIDFPILRPKSIETYIESAIIYKKCRRKGKTVRSTIDCLISAITSEHDASLFHKDRDFHHIAQYTALRLYDI
ncbi:MAG: PIN domain nuclease [Deltaproteobacteria bacterium]|nr:PIN domain nuclease [Deltaproteobacteria bacterium]